MPEFVLSARERELVALLADGHTDVTAARQLQIAERSVTNLVRSLMDRCGVNNRFQLGFALAALGVAPRPPGMASLDSEPAEPE
jgi:LuxR family transcriptional regulator of spore coat protein